MMHFATGLPRMVRHVVWVFWLTGTILPARAGAPDILVRFSENEFVRGQLLDSNSPTLWRVQHPAFAQPLEIPTSSITAITMSHAVEKGLSIAANDFGLQMKNGDRLFGQITAVDEATVTLERTGQPPKKLRREFLARAIGWPGGRQIPFSGPGLRTEWMPQSNREQWRDMVGQLSTNRPGARLHRDIQLPVRACVEMEIVWQQKPDFQIALGIDPNRPNHFDDAVRIEVWKDEIVAVWESETSAAVVVIAQGIKEQDSLRISVDIDQVAGTADFFSPSGRPLGQLRGIQADQSPPAANDAASGDTGGVEPIDPRRSGISIKNQLGDFRLTLLQVLQIRRTERVAGDLLKDAVQLADGSVIAGRWTSVDSGEWIVMTDGEARRIPIADIRSIALASEPSDTQAKATLDRLAFLDQLDDDLASKVQIHCFDGSRYSGTLAGIAGDQLQLATPLAMEPLDLPISTIRQIDRLHAPDANMPAIVASGAGGIRVENVEPEKALLTTHDLRLRGDFVDAEPDHSPTPLRFHPVGSSPVTLMRDCDATWGMPSSTAEVPLDIENIGLVVQGQPMRNGRILFALNGQLNRLDPRDANSEMYQVQVNPSITLRSGEQVSGDVVRLDDDELVMTSSMTGERRIPVGVIASVQVNRGPDRLSLPDGQRERLLTVPRVRKNHPPTHLVQAVNGDVLRCKLLSIDAEIIRVQSRLDTLELDRKTIAKIIWLNQERSPDETTNPDRESFVESAVEAQPTIPVRIESTRGQMLRLSLRSVINGTLIGDHPQFQSVSVPLASIQKMTIGRESSLIPRPESAESPLRLADAPEPLEPPSGGGGSGARGGSGASSPLVGKLAPALKLALLGGGRFDVADHRGRVLVLDFWATWCGPCLRAMPMIDEAVAGFDATDVQLVAVNLQEADETIQATLDRLDLHPRVALDIDGVAAGRYQANAIPQTVVIGRNGKVASVFIGGGDDLKSQLIDSIQACLDAPAE